MKRVHLTPRAWVIAGALCAGVGAAQAQQVLLSEGFDNVPNLSTAGWVIGNMSTPVGDVTEGWYQGTPDPTRFAAQIGFPTSYAASSFNTAAAGGTLSNWLITPSFSTASDTQISFWVRGANDAGFFDSFSYGLSSGSSDSAAFSLLPTSVAPTADWTQVTLTLPAQGAGTIGRLAIVYSGAADTSNYIGIDTLSVTAVPEPQTWLLSAAGLAACIAVVRRRKSAR